MVHQPIAPPALGSVGPNRPDAPARPGEVLRWPSVLATRVLIVDPEPAEAALTSAMAEKGVEVTSVSNTLDGLVEYGRTLPHSVVVAPDAPGIDPGDFVRTVRRRGQPFVLAALGPDTAALASPQIGALMLAGAAGVLGRPYDAAEMWSLLQSAPRPPAARPTIIAGPIELDPSAFSVRVHGERIADLPLKAFELLMELMLAAPHAVGDAELRIALWGDDTGHGSKALAMHVTRLRAMLGEVATIRRIRGQGYSLDAGGPRGRT